MKNVYRIICNASIEVQSSSTLTPSLMLPEQVQILLENGLLLTLYFFLNLIFKITIFLTFYYILGFANVRRAKKIGSVNPTSTQIFNSFADNEQILINDVLFTIIFNKENSINLKIIFFKFIE